MCDIKYSTGDENQLLVTRTGHCCAEEEGWNAKSQDTQKHDQDVAPLRGIILIVLVRPLQWWVPVTSDCT